MVKSHCQPANDNHYKGVVIEGKLMQNINRGKLRVISNPSIDDDDVVA